MGYLVGITSGSFHSKEFSRMYTYFEDCRFSKIYSGSLQHGKILNRGQHAGAEQHTQHPFVCIPGLRARIIEMALPSRRDIIFRPLFCTGPSRLRLFSLIIPLYTITQRTIDCISTFIWAPKSQQFVTASCG